MAIEIERKFLVAHPHKAGLSTGKKLTQGYLARDAATVRVRVEEKGRSWLTIKGPSVGMSCPEFEYIIPRKDAREMLAFEGVTQLTKTRHLVGFAGKRWEVDVFHGPLEGLVMAELELKSETEEVKLPAWLGEEVTGRREWSNESLARLGRPDARA